MHLEHLDRFKEMLLPLFEMSLEEGEDRSFVDMTFGKEATLEDIRKASGKEFMGTFMLLFEAQLQGDISFNSIDVLGSIPEGDVIHVLARMEVGAVGIEMRQMEVLSFHRQGDDWLVSLTGEMEGIAQALRAQAGLIKERQEAEEASASEDG